MSEDYEWYRQARARPWEEWEPGVPLADHPWSRSDAQYVRDIFELVSDDVNAGIVGYTHGELQEYAHVCIDCQVGWGTPDPCWVCGENGVPWEDCRGREGRLVHQPTIRNQAS